MYTDTHCHLDPDVFDGDLGVDAAVQRARDALVGRMVTIGSGYGVPCAQRSLAVANRHPDVWCTIGLHPHDAKDLTQDVLAELTELARHPRCVAWGEAGLDFHYDNSPRDVQRASFRAQIRAARDLDLPITIHDRASDGEAFAILVEEGAFGGPGVLFHCYSGDVASMHAIVALGGYVSIPGIVTFPKATTLHEVARSAPLDRLVLETDAPFLTPVPFRGQRNEPSRIPLVAARVAALRGVAVDELAEATTANALAFYRIAP
jgi:TatD DNase family protein